MFDFLSSQFSSLFSALSGKARLSEQEIARTLDQVKESLLQADVPYDVVQTFAHDIAQEVARHKLHEKHKPADLLIKIVHDRIKAFLGEHSRFEFLMPSVTLMMGLQGSGKTTTIAKLAHLILHEAAGRGKTRDIMVASVDYYRPAAIDQLQVLAQQVNVFFYRAQAKSVIQATQEIMQVYRERGPQLLFLDTAGRLHVESQLIQELVQINQIVQPRYKFLVLDAMTGQESVNVAKAFDQAVGVDGVILSKLDSDTRGGVAFACRYALKKPILFFGVGEKVADLEYFYPDRIAGRMLGMGDVLSLAEKADAVIKKDEQEAANRALSSGRLTLNDFIAQCEMLNRLGSFSQIVKYIPGLGGHKITPEMIERGERELNQFKAIIQSMTLKERLNHRILDGSRKRRVAGGAGVTVEQVNRMLTRFEEIQQSAKLFAKLGKFPGLFK